MMKQVNEVDLGKDELVNIFLDNSANQLENQFFLNKKKMLNAQKGQNELTEVIKMKLKGLEMLYQILVNNKTLMQSEDLNCLEDLYALFLLAKNEKTLFSAVSKKIKTITCLIIKNQINIKNEEQYSVLNKFIIFLLNLSYENSFYQQICSYVSTDKKFFNIFFEALLEKFFKGRNVNIKANEMKFIFKFLINSNYISVEKVMESLCEMLHTKANGGSRTSHQVNLAVSILIFIVDLLMSKGDDLKLNAKKAKSILDKLLEAIQENIEEEEKKKSSITEMRKFAVKFDSYLEKTGLGNKETKKVIEEIEKIIKDNQSTGDSNKDKKSDKKKSLNKDEE